MEEDVEEEEEEEEEGRVREQNAKWREVALLFALCSLGFARCSFLFCSLLFAPPSHRLIQASSQPERMCRPTECVIPPVRVRVRGRQGAHLPWVLNGMVGYCFAVRQNQRPLYTLL
ncbi:hypothetical protein PINS_up006556 [Pythium insidiosum]|nr:hypothetical protein PINS_up006556 [Pythium insidiosum]